MKLNALKKGSHRFEIYKNIFLIIFLLIFIVNVETAKSQLINYEVFCYHTGDWELSKIEATGNIVIDDEKNIFASGTYINYYVDYFNFDFADYNFVGDVGNFHFQYWGSDYGWNYGVDYAFLLFDYSDDDLISTSETDPHHNWTNFNPDPEMFTLPETFGCYANTYNLPTRLDTYYFLFANPTTNGNPAPVPEPASIILFGSGLLGILTNRASKKKNRVF